VPREVQLLQELTFGHASLGDPATFPIYGYLTDLTEPLGPVDADPRYPRRYGACRVVLRPDVAARTTFVVGDSRGFRWDYADRFCPCPLSLPSVFAFLLDDADQDPLTRTLWADGLGYRSYCEAQIHGGVTIDHVAEIHLPADAEDDLVARVEQLAPCKVTVEP
jgi:hypothetical protein